MKPKVSDPLLEEAIAKCATHVTEKLNELWYEGIKNSRPRQRIPEEQLGKWVVDVKGKAEEDFEISLIRENDWHSRESWGWHGKNKIFICGSGGAHRYRLTKRLFAEMVSIAHKECERYNMEEGR